jgi:hypothetical protein
MNSLTSQIIVDIIKTEMELGDQIAVDDLNWQIPPIEDIIITVGLADAQPMSNKSYLREDDTGVYEVSAVTMRENIQIDIMSRGTPAMQRRWEVLAALQSIYSQQQQEINSFKIFRMPTAFVNTSAAEGGSQLARYTLTFACHVWYKKEKLLSATGGDYYDEFSTRVDDENTIGEDDGLFEFVIDDTSAPWYDVDDWLDSEVWID